MDIASIDRTDAALVDQLVAINNAAVPAVGELDAARMLHLIEISSQALLATVESQVAGFCLVLEPGTDYTSVNYRWFCDRYVDMVYLDRIVIVPGHRGHGVGRALYQRVAAEAGDAQWFCLEVNLRPRNDESLAFHDRLGFVEVGQQETDYGSLVTMRIRQLG